MTVSQLHKARYAYIPRFPAILDEPIESIAMQKEQETASIANAEEIQPLFPHIYGKPVVHFVKGTAHIDKKPLRVGTILSGGQAPGGHNVIAGLYDGLQKANPNSKLFGFLGGPEGLVIGRAI